MMLETWKPIPGFGGHYEASDLGSVRVKDRYVKKRTRHGGTMTQFYPGRILVNSQDYCTGYRRVKLGWDHKRAFMGVHRLVLLAFNGAPPPDTECCHGNGIQSDNRLENLRWDTHFENNQDRKKHGHYATGRNHVMAKFTFWQIADVQIGKVSKTEALRLFGMSHTSFYRLKRAWTHYHDLDLPAFTLEALH